MKSTSIFLSTLAFLVIASFNLNKVGVNGLTCYICRNQNGCLSGNDLSALRPQKCLPAPHGHKAYCTVRAIRPRTKAEETSPRRFARACSSKDPKDNRKCRMIKATGRIECFCTTNKCNTMDIRKTNLWKAAAKSRRGPGGKFRQESRNRQNVDLRYSDAKYLPYALGASDNGSPHPPHVARYSDAKYGPQNPYGLGATSNDGHNSKQHGVARYSDAKYGPNDPYGKFVRTSVPYVSQSRSRSRPNVPFRPESRSRFRPSVPYISKPRVRPSVQHTSEAKFRPDTSFIPGASYRPGSPYRPEHDTSLGPGSSFRQDSSFIRPDNSFRPGSSFTPDSSFIRPDNSFRPGSSFTPDSSFIRPGTPLTPGSSFRPDSSSTLESRFKPYFIPQSALRSGSSFKPNSRYRPDTSLKSESRSRVRFRSGAQLRSRTRTGPESKYSPSPDNTMLHRFPEPKFRPSPVAKSEPVVNTNTDVPEARSKAGKRRRPAFPVLTVAERTKLEARVKFEAGYVDDNE